MSMVRALREDSETGAAYERALRYLASRPRSCEEVRRHLVKSGISASAVAQVMERLRERGYVDDAAFSRFWIENRERFKPMGPRALSYELAQKGVDRGLFAELLAGLDVEASALRAARKHMWRYRGRARDDFRRGLWGMLRRRGFEEWVIRGVILRLEAEREEGRSDAACGLDEG